VFRKFVISVLLLPACLGFEIATASQKNELQVLPTSEQSSALTVQTKANKNEGNSLANAVTEYSSIPEDWESDTEKVKHRRYHHYKRYRRYYRHHRRYYQRYRNYHLRRYYYPQNIYYRRQYHDRYRNYHQRVYEPLYCHYLRYYDHRQRNYRLSCY
jgi:Ni/Co efflux regulator RcnB